MMNNYWNLQSSWLNFSKVVFSITLLVLFLNAQSVAASQKLITYYVGIDSVNNSAYVYDQNFDQLPDNPFIPKSSIVQLPNDKPLWYIASNTDVVRRNGDGSIDDVSANPAYSEMVHHIVWGYTAPNRNRTYPCQVAMLIPVGSELINFHFPKGYGYKLDGGALLPIWHWENPASVDTAEKIYLRFNMIFDDEDAGYTDTNIDWVDAVQGCRSAFAVAPGKTKKVTPKLPIDSDRRIIAVIPHIHDHGDEIKLKNNDGTIREFKPEYQNIPVAHDDMGQGPTLIHSDEKHLPVNGLYPWTPGQYGPIIKAGDSLWLETTYENPHPIDIDNMLIAFVFWEAL